MNIPSSEVFLQVESTNAVDPILEKYKEIPGDSAISRYYEQAYVIGEDIPAFIFGENIPALTISEELTEFYTSATFAQYGIEDGDTLHLLLSNRRYIVIQNEFIGEEEIHYLMPLLTTIANLKEIVRRDYEDRVDHPPAEKLALMIGNTPLDDSKTLADYNTDECSKIRLCTRHLIIPIGMPMYTKMERILFKPRDTIAILKGEVERTMSGFECTAGIRAAYPVLLRGAVEYTSGATSYFYLDLFCDEMKTFVFKLETDNLFDHFGCFLGDQYTLNDIRRILRKEYRDGEFFDTHSGLGRTFPMYYCFDHVWTQTFAPRLEAEPLSSNKPIPLFFFPLKIKVVQLRIPPPSTRISDIIHLFRERVRSIKGVDRVVYNPRTNSVLKPSDLIENAHVPGWSPYSVIITKRRRRKIEGKRAEIKIRWRTADASRKVPLKIGLSDTINTLQHLIEDIIQVPFSMQELMLDGQQVVQGNSTLHEVGIKDGSKLDLHLLLDDE